VQSNQTPTTPCAGLLHRWWRDITEISRVATPRVADAADRAVATQTLAVALHPSDVTEYALSAAVHEVGHTADGVVVPGDEVEATRSLKMNKSVRNAKEEKLGRASDYNSYTKTRMAVFTGLFRCIHTSWPVLTLNVTIVCPHIPRYIDTELTVVLVHCSVENRDWYWYPH
jgi:hypothetical protein